VLILQGTSCSVQFEGVTQYKEVVCLAASRSWTADSDSVSEQPAATAVSEAADNRDVVPEEQ
jgi:hypothetical protein